MNNSGFNLLTLFTFFYAIFWASTLEFNSKYHPFDPVGFFSKLPGAYKIRRRFYVSVIFLDLIPVSFFALVFYLYTHFLKVDNLNWLYIIFTGISALSVFGFTRIYPAIVASDKTHKYFYNRKQLSNLPIARTKNSFIAYLISSLMYLLIPFLTISAMFLLQ
ncbi:MAG: hypothetical protein HW405_281 [Candidatus Berkelbacteria bacterium]|nr:hypothetical protein [Candidatus Berkelbacteria bacterium]